jgi:RHS repeat-associated protein
MDDKNNKNENKIEHHKITLPKGGGAISGIGEKFQANAVTGTGSFSIPIPATPARGGFEPKLALSYDSGNGNSAFGLGWSVDIPAVTRKTAKGLPKYLDSEESDTFLLSGVEDLVPGNGDKKNFYRPRIEGLFARIEKKFNTDGSIYWEAVTKDNITSIYGKSEESRISDPNDPQKIFKWHLERSFDAKGNTIVYEYKAEDESNVEKKLSEKNRFLNDGTFTYSNKYIKKIKYGNKYTNSGEYHFTILFDYGEHNIDEPALNENEQGWPVRKDPFSDYKAGFETRTYRLCKRIILFHDFPELGENPVPVKSIELEHEESEIVTYLKAVTQKGYKKRADNTWETKKFPKVEYTYSKPEIDEQVRRVEEQGLENLPQGLSGTYQWVDFEGEGLSGIFTQQGSAMYYKRNEGNGKFSSLITRTSEPVPSQITGQPRLTDIDGDGNNELVLHDRALSGYFSYKNGKWENFRTFSKNPNLDFNDPSIKMIDLTGDGHPDLLISQERVFTWYESDAKQGYNNACEVSLPLDEDQGPTVIFAEPEQTIFLSDMSGDGLTDIVRIRNGNVCYWPNLGYGRFGAKVTMENAPVFDSPHLFNPQYIKLGDIDGSGTTDIFYLGNSKVTYWFNRSGNSFGKAHELPYFPSMDSASSAALIDLLGKGTSCLAWSTALPGKELLQLSYVDLMSTGKPHLLTKIDNHMGKVVNIHYAPYTKFYLADRKNNKPWITKLPFPVHVLEKVETIDHVSGSKLVTTYRYHHGYFDGEEREFRGFGMVETLDTETFAEYSIDPRDYVKPILTKTWFHNGAFIEQQDISKQYAKEYFKGIDIDNPDILPDTVIENEENLDAEEIKEAHRALKGKTLRQEVYEIGVDVPYTVTESNFIVKQLQPKGEQKHAVFVVHPRETITWHYEQDASDPRIAHDFTLRVDDWGNIENTCSLVYPRKTASEYPEQERLYATFAHNSFINKPDGSGGDEFYLIGVPKETRSYEIGGIAEPSDGSYIRFDYFFNETGEIIIDNAPQKSFDEEVSHEILEKRLLSWQQFLYWNEEQNDVLSPGEITSKALLHHVETAVLTPGLVTAAFGSLVTAQVLQDAGYRFNQNHWWNPGLVQHYSIGDFYLPIKTEDPFENSLTVTYDDPYKIVPVKTEDQLGNTSTAEIDYRTMTPWKLTGPNNNSTEAITDPLGMVTATSVYGTENSINKGDLPLESYAVQNVTSLQDVIDNPHTYLQDATTFFYYDLEAWKDRGEPVQAIGLARESHVSELEPEAESEVQFSITYSDGFGRELQSKLKVEPGKAWVKQSDNTFVEEEVPDRWLVSGRTVYNNKEKPVKQYEPFYSASHQYEAEAFFAQYGVTPILRYDPLLRVIRTDTAKGFFSNVRFTPWKVERFDVNDTVKESDYYKRTDISQDEKDALKKAEAHYDTPQVTLLDTLGREFITKNSLMEGDEEPYTKRELVTYTEFDITGKPLTITDPRQYRENENRSEEEKVKTFKYTYDMTGETLRTISIDAGDDRVLANIMGSPVLTLDAKGHLINAEYDELHRLIKKKVTGNGLDNTVEVLQYGESQPNSKENNLRGQLYYHYDQSGKITIPMYDIKGQPLKSEKKIRTDYQNEANWVDGNNWSLLLNEETFILETRYDALGRVTLQKNPDGSETRPEFHQSGKINKIDVKLKAETGYKEFVKGITYNPKGQREKIICGNDTETIYSYERETFRLTKLETSRTSDNKNLQDITYVYDPVGNITKITDNSHDRVFNHNQEVDPACQYVYDALYRLIEAAGREHLALKEKPAAYKDANSFKQSDFAHPEDQDKLTNYKRTYAYDDAGNLHLLRHFVPYTSLCFTRELEVDTGTNRALLKENGIPPDIAGSFDENGNVTKLEHIKKLEWNYRDNIASAAIIEHTNGNINDTEYYAYDASGQRVRKVKETWKGNGVVEIEEKIYLGAVEIKRIRTEQESVTTPILERFTLHIMDDKNRIAIVHHWTLDKNTREIDNTNELNKNKIRYQYGNHLGSASLELDNSGNIISYEEYFPYGGTSFIAGKNEKEVKLKEYRYTGKERDDSTGLYYYGARYYAPWLIRWLSADPAGPVDGLNLYVYVSNNPIRKIDSMGMQEDEQNQNLEPETDNTKNNKKKKAKVKIAKKFGRIMAKAGKESIKKKTDKHRGAIADTGIGTYGGTKSPYESLTKKERKEWIEQHKKPGTQPQYPELIGCIKWAMKHVEAAYKKLGGEAWERWKEIRSKVYKDDLRGATLAKELQKEGWTVVYVNRDVNEVNPETAKLSVYSTVRKNKEVVNYNPSASSSTTKETSEMEKLKKVEFFFGMTDTHAFVGSEGRISEAHWTSDPDDPDIITETKKIEELEEAIIVITPGTWPK